MAAVSGGFFDQSFDGAAPAVATASHRVGGDTREVIIHNPSSTIPAQVQALAYCASST
jgi:hypothetical protein